MIISRTPYRISFLGGGTDYPYWYLKNGGQVLSTTIDKYIYITCRTLPPFFEHRLRLVYSSVEYCQDANELLHPSAKQVLKYMGTTKDLEIHYDGDLPARSGMGSSSAFTTGLLTALNRYKKINLSKKNLAKTTIHIEQNLTKEIVGSQDQISAAYGGFNHIKFYKSGNFIVRPIKLSSKKIRSLENKLMIFHTGIFRTAENISKNYFKNYKQKELHLNKMHLMVNDAINILKNGNLDDFGKLLNDAWFLKKSLSKEISNSIINDIYETALSNGALGGKLLGAGGGGFLIFYVPESKQKKIKKILSKLLFIPLKFEKNGSQIIYDLPEKQYTNEEYARSKNQLKSFKEYKDL